MFIDRCLGFAKIETFEFGESVLKKQLLFPDGTVTMFTDDDVGNSFSFRIGVVYVFPVNEHDHVGILFDRTALSQIGQHGDRRFTSFYGTTQLGQCHNRHIQFFRQGPLS